MSLRYVYYFLKPFLPRSVRISVRRWRAERLSLRFADTWPISPAAAQAPEGWPGWPDGKKFALVLTHDVEGRVGLERCRQLMESEARMGFCSSFNFVPEGEYCVSKELRDSLTANGFEVGVHDLKHDGKLYVTRSTFRRYAKRINHYVKEWNAAGFRSGFMHHRLDWLGDLNILYDASTFDTDPFEPQPDGVNTIFPFWVSRRNGSGYLELPYTLVQDFTLFILLEQRNDEIWRKKLDWLASRGGMVLMNTHPDYMNFNGNGLRTSEFPARFYREFLSYVKERYEGQYWNCLPRDIASYCLPFRPRRPNVCKRRICMLSHSQYETDNRVRRYAETLAERGDEVDVISLNYGKKTPKFGECGNVNVVRVQRRFYDEKSKWTYLRRLIRFIVVSSFTLTRLHLKRPYDLVHVHNIPDFLVFAAWLPKLTRTPVILDIHDIVPEFYASKFNGASQDLICKCLFLSEKFSCGFAEHVIISNHIWWEKLVGRSVPREKCLALANHVDDRVFRLRKRTRSDGRLIIVFPGGLQWHQGLDIAIRAFALAQRELPQLEFHIYGEGDQKQALQSLVDELGMQSKILFHEGIPLTEMPELMANADLGIVPKRANSFGNEAYSTKIMEFMSQGVPVVVSRTKIDSFYFDDTVVQFFEAENPHALAEAMLRVLRDEELKQSLVKNALEYVTRNSWRNKKEEYLNLVDSLLTKI